jgi:hypothetical protein
MYHVDNSTGVPVMPQPSPVTSETELFFTEGGNGVPPTYPGPDWFNTIQSELLNILRALGLILTKWTIRRFWPLSKTVSESLQSIWRH